MTLINITAAAAKRVQEHSLALSVGLRTVFEGYEISNFRPRPHNIDILKHVFFCVFWPFVHTQKDPQATNVSNGLQRELFLITLLA